MENGNRLNLPKILNIRLNNFSLYTLKPNISIEMKQGVVCLAGANGLGKSTFIAAVNYALTGIVREPYRKFESVEDYYKDALSRTYSDQYFEGRINETDRDEASLSIKFQSDDSIYSLTRGVFEPEQLQELMIINSKNGKVIFDGSMATPNERNSEYKIRLTKDIGLNSFQQYVFLQLFVFTFDESRFLLLWDRRALNTAIHLCVGADFKKVQESEKLLREMDRAGSRARNYNWQATSIRGEITAIQEALGVPSNIKNLEELGTQHEQLQNELSQIEKQIEQRKEFLNDTQLTWSEANSKYASLQISYNKEFAFRIQKQKRVEFNPVIASSLADSKCAICGNHSDNITKTIKSRIENRKCPLCDSTIPEPNEDQSSLDELKEIDRKISELKTGISSFLKTIERITGEIRALEKSHDLKYELLEQFEKENEKAIYQIRNKANGAVAALKSKREILHDLLKKKKIAYDERDKKKNEYLDIQRELERLYSEAQEKFVPMFRELAFLFLGIPVDIRVEFSTSIDSPGVSLILELHGIVRRQDQQLSESQRFFVDIALRMAIAQYMVRGNINASLFIDTPEGSLDIAYESRVGQMFAAFVRRKNNLLITANINSSQILLKLASECGHENMILYKMTNWTELSEVQEKEDDLFNKALQDIENALISRK